MGKRKMPMDIKQLTEECKGNRELVIANVMVSLLANTISLITDKTARVKACSFAVIEMSESFMADVFDKFDTQTFAISCKIIDPDTERFIVEKSGDHIIAGILSTESGEFKHASTIGFDGTEVGEA